MAQTYAQIQDQIASLQKKAEALREKEVQGVIGRIQVAIAHYGLTPEQLFPASSSSASAGKPGTKRKARTAYSDGQGNAWSGFGKRPAWLREALASGRRLEDLQVNSEAAAAAPKKVKQKRRPSRVTYTDGAGHSWTGRGPQPRWLKEALAGGKTLDELRS